MGETVEDGGDSEDGDIAEDGGDSAGRVEDGGDYGGWGR